MIEQKIHPQTPTTPRNPTVKNQQMTPKIWHIIDLIQWTTTYFERHDIPTPRLDVELLLGHVLKKSRLQLYLSFDMPVFHEQLSAFRELVKQRAAHTPVSYLTNHKEFMSLDFYVDRRVLIPRPETETLVETVLEKQQEPCRVIDIGTGSGAIAISLAVNRPEWEIFATDISADALEVAQQNAETHDVANQINFLCSNLFEAVRGLENPRFDWLVSNPPYVSIEDHTELPPHIRDHEPEIALAAGVDGLDVIRRIIAQAPEFLNPGGRLILELGLGQSLAVQELVRTHPAYRGCEAIKDYSGIERVIVAGL
jgi:release factor glutamine methyltransferase